MVFAVLALLMVVGSFFSFYRASQYYARRAKDAEEAREREKRARQQDDASGDGA